MNTNLNKLFLLCLFLPTELLALWSGVSLTIGDQTIPVKANDNQLSLTPFVLRLDVEDKTANGLRVGASMSKMSVELKGSSIDEELSGEILSIYLYYPYQFNDLIGINSRVSFDKVSSRSDDENKEIEYLSKSISVGISLTVQNIRIIPSTNYMSLSGDYLNASDSNSFSFKQEYNQYSSLAIDYFIEPNSFIRFNTTEHTDGAFSISFSTIY